MVLDAVLADRDADLAGDRARQARVLHADASDPAPGSAVADLPRRAMPRRSGTSRTSCRSALDPDGRTHVFLYLLTRDVADRLPRLPRAPRRAAPGAAGVDRSAARAVPHDATRLPLYKAAFREQLASPLRPVVVDDLRWYFRAPRARRRARMSASIRRCAPSARRGFRRCIARGSSAVTRCSMRRCHHVGRRDRPRDGPVGVPCLTASLRASLPPGRHGLTGSCRGRRGGRRPRACSSAHPQRR